MRRLCWTFIPCSSGLEPLLHEVPREHGWWTIELPEYAEPQSLVRGAGPTRVSSQSHLTTPSDTCFLLCSPHQFSAYSLATEILWYNDQREIERTPQR